MDLYSHSDGSRECRPIEVRTIADLPEAWEGVRIPILAPGAALGLRREWPDFLPAVLSDIDLSDAPSYTLPLNGLSWDVHADNIEAGWWSDMATGARKDRNVGEMLMLVVSELAEGAEGLHLMDDKLPHRPMLEVELADAKIRILDIAGSRQFDLSGAAHDLITVAEMTPGTWFGLSGALMQIVCEVSRAMEGHRKNAADRVLPFRKGFEVGLAAALLRIHWLGEAIGIDVDAAMEEKRAFNRVREDHQVEARRQAGGKAY